MAAVRRGQLSICPFSRGSLAPLATAHFSGAARLTLCAPRSQPALSSLHAGGGGFASLKPRLDRPPLVRGLARPNPPPRATTSGRRFQGKARAATRPAAARAGERAGGDAGLRLGGGVSGRGGGVEGGGVAPRAHRARMFLMHTRTHKTGAHTGAKASPCHARPAAGRAFAEDAVAVLREEQDAGSSSRQSTRAARSAPLSSACASSAFRRQPRGAGSTPRQDPAALDGDSLRRRSRRRRQRTAPVFRRHNSR
jgi:hypothetical protein